MPIWTVIATADTTTRTIEDMGVTITASTSLTLSEFFDFSDIADSQDLIALVTAGHIVISTAAPAASNTLTAAEGLNYIKRDNIHDDLDRHYTKDELTTVNSPGGDLVDWSNIANAPSFGSPVWIEPVLYRITEQAAVAPTVGAVGDVYFNTADDNYYKSNGTIWVSDGSAADGDRVIDISSDPQVVTVFDGSDFIDLPESLDNSAVMVNDDGDNKNAQYVYSTETDVWIKIADVDFEDHLDGGDSKHDASEIDVESTTLVNITSAPDDLETVIADIDTLLTEALDNNDLDSAYDEPTAGAGRLIDADSGPVEIDGSGTRAGFRITPRTNMPSSTPQQGELVVVDNILYTYDATRLMWLSVNRELITFGRRRNTRNQYLNLGVGNMPSNNSGFRMSRDGVITTMTGQVDGTTPVTCDFQVRRNDQPTAVATLTLTAVVGATALNTAQTFDADDFLQAYLSSGANVPDPVMVIEIAYTLT